MTQRILNTLLVFFSVATSLHAASRAENLAKKPDEWFRSEAGEMALSAILSWQSEHGDWPKNQDTVSKERRGDRSRIRGTFDNGATTSELRVLARAYRATGKTKYKQAFLNGFDHILEAQYPNGGWPQYFPLRKGYYSHITFNDGCMIRLMELLRDATTKEDFSLLDNERRMAATAAIERGIDCIVNCQVEVDEKPTVWCAQHDEATLAPAKARSYELASLSGSESAGVLNYLISLEDPSPEVIRAVNAGAAWFKSAKIEGFRYEKSHGERTLVEDASGRGLWARFYELETNRPFFCDRDGIPKYSIDEIGKERRNGYSWYSTRGERVLKAYSKWPYRPSASPQNCVEPNE